MNNVRISLHLRSLPDGDHAEISFFKRRKWVDEGGFLSLLFVAGEMLICDRTVNTFPIVGSIRVELSSFSAGL